MDDECEIVGSVDRMSPGGGPPAKKLKQSRLPFAPLNTKSPKQTDAVVNEKKRKLSGEGEASTATKTPRSESKQANAKVADENQQTPTLSEGTKDQTLTSRECKSKLKSPKASSEKEKQDQGVKKKGRPPGAKNKSAITDKTPQDDGKKKDKKADGSPPAVRQRGRPKGSSKKSNFGYPGLDNSNVSEDVKEEDTTSSTQGKINDDEGKGNRREDVDKKDKSCIEEAKVNNEVKSDTKMQEVDSKDDGKSNTEDNDAVQDENEEEDNAVKEGEKGESKKRQEEKSEETDDKKNDADRSMNTIEETSKCNDKGSATSEKMSPSKMKNEESSETETKASNKDDKGKEENDKSTDESEKGEKAKKCGRPKGSIKRSLMPQEDDKPKKKKGRPPVSKNTPKDDKQSNLDKSSCSITSDEESDSSINNTPVGSKKKTPIEKTRSLLSLFACKAQVGSATKSSITEYFKKGKSSPTTESKEAKSSSTESKEAKSSTTESKEAKSSSSTESKEAKSPSTESKEAKSSSTTESKETKSPSTESKEAKSSSTTESKEAKSSSTTESKEAKSSTNESNEAKSSPTNESKIINCTDDGKFASCNDLKDSKSASSKENKNKELNKEKNRKEEREVKVIDSDSKNYESDSDEEENSNLGEERILFPLERNEKSEGKNEDEKDDSENDETKDEDDVEETDDDDDDSKEEKDQVKKSEIKSSQSKDGLDESASEMEVSTCDSEMNASQRSSPANSSDPHNSNLTKTPTSTGPKIKLFTKPKKLTPNQKEKEAAKLLRMEERAKQKEEKEKQLQEKMAEKEKMRKQKEEERKQKEEEKKQKEEEKLKQKEEREKAKEELRKKKQEEIDAKKVKKVEEVQKKEEERLKKEEEKLKKEEEQLKKDAEKRKHSDLLKRKFASFFVAKKKETDDEVKENDGPFQEFQVKEDMQLAPIVRQRLSESQYAELDEFLTGKQDDDSLKTYLEILKTGSYKICKSQRTFPLEKKKEEEDDDDIEIIEDEDEEDMGNVIQDPAAVLSKGQSQKAKFLSFCENRRPAYWGTWSKKSALVSARRPLAKDEIFDYDYDSDDDWEEEEAGESLSDSEGEDKEEKEDECDQYEVDNDFFVPHGYLSDDEGKSDQEEEDEDEEAANKNEQSERSRNTEQLKQKQAEFEEEMKKKTKELKPRVVGCLWMADKNNNPAYSQLMKLLGPHRAVTMCSQRPISTSYSRGKAKESKDVEHDEDNAADQKLGKNYVKTFPQEAIPVLIKLLHGNRHAKSKLCREFCDYWSKLNGGELDENQINPTPKPTPIESGTLHIAKRKVDGKIQEIGHWKRHLDTNTSRYVMCWYVPKKTREEYGFADLDLPNSWIYINKPTRKEELDEDEVDSPKVSKIRPITAFTKKIPSAPSSTNTSPVSSINTTPQRDLHPKMEGVSELGGTPSNSTCDTPKSSDRKKFELNNKTPGTSNAKNPGLATPEGTPDTPTGKHLPCKHGKKKKVNLFPVKTPEPNGPKKGSIVSFFKKNLNSPTMLPTTSTQNDSEEITIVTTPKPCNDDDIIVLD